MAPPPHNTTCRRARVGTGARAQLPLRLPPSGTRAGGGGGRLRGAAVGVGVPPPPHGGGEGGRRRGRRGRLGAQRGGGAVEGAADAPSRAGGSVRHADALGGLAGRPGGAPRARTSGVAVAVAADTTPETATAASRPLAGAGATTSRRRRHRNCRAGVGRGAHAATDGGCDGGGGRPTWSAGGGGGTGRRRGQGRGYTHGSIARRRSLCPAVWGGDADVCSLARAGMIVFSCSASAASPPPPLVVPCAGAPSHSTARYYGALRGIVGLSPAAPMAAADRQVAVGPHKGSRVSLLRGALSRQDFGRPVGP